MKKAFERLSLYLHNHFTEIHIDTLVFIFIMHHSLAKHNVFYTVYMILLVLLCAKAAVAPIFTMDAHASHRGDLYM